MISSSTVKTIKYIFGEWVVNGERVRSDGCSTIKVWKQAFTTQIKDVQKEALLAHCFFHSLTFTVSDTIKQSEVIKHALDSAKCRKDRQ